jgi:hypothetical protein
MQVSTAELGTLHVNREEDLAASAQILDITVTT